MKILTVVGARPQFVKAAVVSRAIQAYNKTRSEGETLEEILVHTGQHYDANMSEVFFQEMHIPTPDYHLGIGGGSHGAMTGAMLARLEELMQADKPDVVLVYGDTNSTLAGALAAVKIHIPVAHVEAGLRSFNMHMPEEVNRILTDRVANLLFCPTAAAVENLEAEGMEKGGFPDVYIYQVGDVMYDAALYYSRVGFPGPNSRRIVKDLGQFYLATVHRAENTDNPERLKEILRALDDIATEVPVLLPLHPRTRNRIAAWSLTPENLTIIEPVGYFDMLCFLQHCQGVFTDSGGVQKEAFFFKKPCVTLREETEWVELVDHGFNILAGASYDSIRRAQQASRNIDFPDELNLYGNGNAGEEIVDLLARHLFSWGT